MMAEQKGRGGKKPKYQIADIGGSDLTPQDLSTERVLNFLIKGESVPPEQGTVSEGESVNQASTLREQPAAERAEGPADASLPQPPAQGKKSLDHLFRRASAGGGAKDLKIDLRGREESPQPVRALDVETVEQTQSATPVIQDESAPSPVKPPQAPQTLTVDEPAQPVSHSVLRVEPDVRPQAADTGELTPESSTATPVPSTELGQLISLWRNFYRLKDGEIDALTALYQISHAQGTDECYVKMHKLSEMSNLTYRYCQKVVRSLEQLGWITKLKDYDPTTQLGVLYRINLNPSL